MAKEPEPQSTGQSSNSSFSAEAQLGEFRAQLDQDVKKRRVTIIPGYLFRDCWELRTNQLSLHKFGMVTIDEELLELHAETYRRGLEARDQLLERIKPVEILEMVRNIWGKGEVSQSKEGTTLTYQYQKADEEWESVPSTHSYFGGSALSPETFSPGYSYKTGKWRIWILNVEEKVGVNFGGYSPEYQVVKQQIQTPEMNEFFADHYYSAHSNGYQPAPERFVGLPKTIWWKPENLGIYVTVPYTLHEVRNEGILQGCYRSNTRDNPFARFDKSASQQDIMDYLSQKLEAQKAVGQLPYQMEALELTKIEELRKRGLLVFDPKV